MTLTLEKPPSKTWHSVPQTGVSLREGYTKLQPGHIKLVQEKAKKNEDRLRPEAMAQVS